MGRVVASAIGILGIVVFSPFILAGLGEWVLAVPVVGFCMASLAGSLLRSRR